jgi:C4-dicarboxylate-specific signal transduction histidine kinase
MPARRKIYTLAIVGIWLIAAGVLGNRHLETTTHAYVRADTRQNSLLADTIAAQIGQEFTRLRSLAKILAQSERIQATLPFVGYSEAPGNTAAREQRRADLMGRIDLIEINEWLANTAHDLDLRRIQLLHRSGEVIASSNAMSGANDIATLLFDDRMHALASIVGSADSFSIDAENVPVYRFAAAVVGGNDTIGVLVIEQSSLRIARPLSGHQQRIFVTDEFGVALIAREPDLLMTATAKARVHAISQSERLFRYGQRRLGESPFSPIRDAPVGNGSGWTAAGITYSLVSRPLAGEPLQVNIMTVLHELTALRRTTIVEILLITLVGLLVILVTDRSIAFARPASVAKRLNRSSSQANRTTPDP